jgi:hypothetical protein
MSGFCEHGVEPSGLKKQGILRPTVQLLIAQEYNEVI